MRQGSFLSALIRDPGAAFLLRNMRTGGSVVSFLEPAFESRTRNKGLLGRAGLPPEHGLVIAPSGGVHTWFMKFTIDVLFVNRDGGVRRIVHNLRPYRIAASPLSYCVIETAAGVVAASGTRVGDLLDLEPRAATTV